MTFLAIAVLVAVAALFVSPTIRHFRLLARYRPRTTDLYSGPLSVVANEDTPHPLHFCEAHLGEFVRSHRDHLPCLPVLDAIADTIAELYDQELSNRPITPSQNYLIAEGGYRDQVLGSLNKHRNLALNFTRFQQSLREVWDAYLANLPEDAFDASPHPFARIPLVDAFPPDGHVLNRITLPLWDPARQDVGLFTEFKNRFERNVHAASGVVYPAAARKFIFPHEFRGTAAQLIDTYLKGTALHRLFDVDIPFDFTEQLGEHALLLAPSGWGKSEFIQSLALHLVGRPDPPTIIILNSQGKMLQTIQRLAQFAPGQPLSDRLVIIDPEDESPPALNMFAMPMERMSTYTRNIREQIEAGTIETFQYLFSSVASDLTGKQTTAFQYLIALVLSIKNGSFNTFLELLEEQTKDPKGKDSKFAADIAKLDSTAQGFFENQYFTKSFTETRAQIGQRIYRVVNRGAFTRMFGSAENRLDLFSLMQRGSVILVNTSKAQLGKEGSAFFGRWFVSLIIRAAYERVAVKNPRRTLLVIDEASDYIDQSFDEILSKVRQFNVGCVMAFQQTRQIPILNSVIANTAVKIVGGVEDPDASIMARSMRVTSDWLMSMRRAPHGTEFAAYVRDKTASGAVRMKLPYFWTFKYPMMNDEQHDRLLVRNRATYSAQSHPQTAPPRADEAPDDISMKPTGDRPVPTARQRDRKDDPPDDTNHSTPSKDW